MISANAAKPQTNATTTTGANTTAANATAATTSSAAGAPATISTWQPGLPGWTVVLAAKHGRAAAYAIAERLAGQGIDVGVLDSSQHPALTPGSWVVFSVGIPPAPQRRRPPRC